MSLPMNCRLPDILSNSALWKPEQGACLSIGFLVPSGGPPSGKRSCQRLILAESCTTIGCSMDGPALFLNFLVRPLSVRLVQTFDDHSFGQSLFNCIGFQPPGGTLHCEALWLRSSTSVTVLQAPSPVFDIAGPSNPGSCHLNRWPPCHRA